MNTQGQRAILVIPQSLLERIDRYRDELSRAEFVEFCVESLLNQKEKPSSPGEVSSTGEAGQEEVVSRQEFEEFARRMKGLQQVFINFLLDYGLEPLDRAPAEVQQQFKAEVARLQGS